MVWELLRLHSWALVKQVDAHPEPLLPVCVPAPFNDMCSDCWLRQHRQPHFPTHERLLDCFSDLLGTNGLFTDTSHVCLLHPPHLSSPAKALCPLPAAHSAPFPCVKAGTQWVTAPAALPPSLQKGRRKAREGTSSETSGVHWSVGSRMFPPNLLWKAELRLQFGDG